MNLSPISIMELSIMEEQLTSQSSRSQSRIDVFGTETPNAIDKVAGWNLTISPLSDDDIKVDSDSTFFRYDYKINSSEPLRENEEVNSVSNSSFPLLNNSSIPSTDISISSSIISESSKHLNRFFNHNGDVSYPSTSVENEKKELYNYLKLMNHAEKRTVRVSNNIRSTRAKILERKELAAKLKAEMRKSINQSNEQVQSHVPTNDLSNSFNGKKIFNFVMPPPNVLNEFNDFSHWIAPVVKKSRRLVETFKFNGTSTADAENSQMLSNIQLRNKYLVNKFEKKKNQGLNKFKKKDRDKFKMGTKKSKDNCLGERSDENNTKKINGDNTGFIDDSTNSKNETVNFEKLSEAVQENNVHIRVDYNTLDKNTENQESPVKIGRISLYNGFNEKDIKKSEDLFSNIQNFLNQLNTPPVVEVENPTITINTLTENQPLTDSEENIDDSQYDSEASSDTSMESENSSSSSCMEDRNEGENSSPKYDLIDPIEISQMTKSVQPFHDNGKMKPLHNLLRKQFKKPISLLNNMNSVHDWDSDNSTNDKQKSETTKTSSHFISFDNGNGAVQSAIYVDFQLLLIQEFAVSLWNQTALGNVLGSQNLWIFNGCAKKLILNKECIRKNSLEMVASMDSCIVYVELWTKEHKSDIRQGPVADVFATVYFWIQKLNKMDRKVLQLENINGFADDVQYVVLRPSLNVVVSWHSIVEDNKITQIHVYTLATDLQKVINVRALAKVEHYVSSLHNIEDCDELLMGCGENKITLWNIEHGYKVATIELTEIKMSLCTLWVKCDRGILFTLQQCVDRELRLIAINGRSLSWKRLKSYKPNDGFDRIQNVYIENGILISFYEEGILCWKAQTGDQILEEMHSETDVKYFPSGRHLIMIRKRHVFLQHALTHLLIVDD